MKTLANMKSTGILPESGPRKSKQAKIEDLRKELKQYMKLYDQAKKDFDQVNKNYQIALNTIRELKEQ